MLAQAVVSSLLIIGCLLVYEVGIRERTAKPPNTPW